jgi:hypothetical protein
MTSWRVVNHGHKFKGVFGLGLVYRRPEPDENIMKDCASLKNAGVIIRLDPFLFLKQLGA